MNMKMSLACLIAAVCSAGMQSTQAATFTWDGGGTDGKWSTAQNWTGDTLPANTATAAVTFDGSINTQVSVDSNQTLQSITFSNTAGAFTLDGSTLTIAGTTTIADTTTVISTSSTVTVTVNNNIQMAGPCRFNANAGKLVINGDVALNTNVSTGLNDIRLVAAAGASIELNGVISGTLSTLALNSGGKTIFNRANTYKGRTAIYSSTALVNVDVSNTAGGFGDGSGNYEVQMAATSASNLTPVLLIGGAHTFSRDVRLNGTGTTNNVFKIGGATADTATFSGNIYMGSVNQQAQALTLTAVAGGRFVVSGNLLRATGASSANDTLTITGDGTVVLAGSGNAYLGATSVKTGTLLVNGQLSSGGAAVSVAAGATLGGTGTINRAVSLADNAQLAAGDGGVGKLTVGALTLANGSLILADISGSTSDQVAVNGNLVLDGVLNITAEQAVTPGRYTLFTYTGTLTDNGLTIGTAPAGTTFTLDTSTAGEVALVAVPEPAAVGILGVAGGLALLLRRP